MSKTLLYRIFGVGRLPREERRRLESEGLRSIDQGVPMTISWRRYSEPGAYIVRRHQSATGTVALTARRLVIYVSSLPMLDVSLDDPAADRLAVTCPADGTLAIRMEAGDFKPGCTGTVSYLLFTAEADALVCAWSQRAALPGAA